MTQPVIEAQEMTGDTPEPQPQQTTAFASTPPDPRNRQQVRWRDPERARLRRSANTSDKLVAPLWALKLAEAENLELRFVNDKGSTGQRIQSFRLKGWELLRAPEGMERDPGWTSAAESGADSTLVSRVVDTRSGMRAYLMGIPREWYGEDQRKKQEKIKRAEVPLFRGSGIRDSYGETTTEVKT